MCRTRDIFFATKRGLLKSDFWLLKWQPNGSGQVPLALDSIPLVLSVEVFSCGEGRACHRLVSYVRRASSLLLSWLEQPAKLTSLSLVCLFYRRDCWLNWVALLLVNINSDHLRVWSTALKRYHNRGLSKFAFWYTERFILWRFLILSDKARLNRIHFKSDLS